MPAFPADLVKPFAKAKLVTLFDVREGVEAANSHDVKQSLCNVFAGVPGCRDKLKVRQAADAVLGHLGYLHSTPANWEIAAKHKAADRAFYGYCVTYTTNQGKEETCHYVGNEAVCRKKTLMRPKASRIVKVEGLSESQYVRAYGRGRS